MRNRKGSRWWQILWLLLQKSWRHKFVCGELHSRSLANSYRVTKNTVQPTIVWLGRPLLRVDMCGSCAYPVAVCSDYQLTWKLTSILLIWFVWSIFTLRYICFVRTYYDVFLIESLLLVAALATIKRSRVARHHPVPKLFITHNP